MTRGKNIPRICFVTLLAVLGTAAAVADSDAGNTAAIEDGVRFTVDGKTRSFATASGFYSKISSQFQAAASPESSELFSVTFLSLDLRQFSYPTELPPPRVAGKPVDMRMMMANVGFSYTNADEMEWAGPGKLTIDSFADDGVIVGHFDQVSLPQVDKKAPNILLSGGSFRVRLQ